VWNGSEAMRDAKNGSRARGGPRNGRGEASPFIWGLGGVHVFGFSEEKQRLARSACMPSTVIRSFEYQPSTSALDVTFVSGRRYRYADVPEDVARAFSEAFSKGRFFNTRIRDAYRCTQLNEEPLAEEELWTL
jgi:hypothetical protein